MGWALRALRKFVRLKRPHVIAIGRESKKAVFLKKEVLELVADMKMDEDEFPDIPVEILDNQPARVFAQSQKAQAELGDVPILLKQAVSLARRLQDPLTEFAQLFTPEEDILCVRWHALQDRVPKEELLERLEAEFVNVTNKVGVNLNKAVDVPHTSSTLQFLCGFGPKKASGIIKTLERMNQNLANRAQLILDFQMGPKIFINCSGFLKVFPTDFDSSDSFIHPLDRTRVHPESYEWAKQISVDSLGGTSADSIAAVEDVMQHPAPLREMNIDLFAEHLATTEAGDKTTTLRDIVDELSKPFKDKRAKFTELTSEQIFYLLSNETEDTFYIGKLVTGVIYDFALKKVHPEELDTVIPLKNIHTNLWECVTCDRKGFQKIDDIWEHYDTLSCQGKTVGIRLRLENDVTGFVPAARLSDKEVYNVRDRVHKGQMVHCRVSEIQHDRFSFVGTCRTSALQDVNGRFRLPKDEFYDTKKEEEDLKKEKENEAKTNQPLYMKRVIVHPAFRNISFQEAETLLDSMKPGDCIFRPSSKAHDHLTLTWKVATEVHQHVDIVELRKKNPFSLGETLKIGQDEFEDLDEIIHCYVNPMANFVKEICGYHYYMESIAGDRRKADEYLNDLKKANPTKIHYVLSPSKEMPGKFMLSYLPNKNSVHEFATVTSEGYRFRQKVFPYLNQFINWFKDHFREPYVVGVIPRNAAITVPVNKAPRITPHYAPPNAYTLYSQSAYTTPHMTPAPPMSVVNDDDWNEGAGGGYNSGSRRDDGNWNGSICGNRSNDAFSTDGRSQAGWDGRDRDEDRRGGRGGRGGNRGGRGGRGGDRGGRGGRSFGRGRGGGRGGRGGRDRDSWGGGGDSLNHPPAPFVAPLAIPDDDNWDDAPAKDQKSQFTCPICGFVCRRGCGLKSHMIHKHRDHACNKNNDQDYDPSADTTASVPAKKAMVKVKRASGSKSKTGRKKKDNDTVTVDNPETEEKKIKCTFCNISCKTPGALRNHIFYKHKGKKTGDKVETTEQISKFVCEKCGLDCGREWKLEKHIFNHKIYDNSVDPSISGTDFVCNLCQKTVPTRLLLYRHKMQQHHEELDLAVEKCEECPKVFRTKLQLNTHVQIIHRRLGKYNCDQCTYASMSKDAIDRHMQKHEETREKKYVCEFCSASYCYLSAFRDHLQRYHLEQYEPTRNQGVFGGVAVDKLQSEEKVGLLKKVRRQGQKMKPVNCKYCEDVLPHALAFKMHLKSVHQDLYVHKCDAVDCDRTYMSLQSLQLHKKINHVNKKEVRCGWCFKKVLSKVYLYSHNKCCPKRPKTAENVPKIFVAGEESNDEAQAE